VQAGAGNRATVLGTEGRAGVGGWLSCAPAIPATTSCRPHRASPPQKTFRFVPIRAGWYRLVHVGTAWCTWVPAGTDWYRSVWAQSLAVTGLSVFRRAGSAFFRPLGAICPAVFPLQQAREAQNGPHGRAPLRRFDDALAAKSCANARRAEAVPGSVRQTRLWFSNSSRAHCAPSVLTGDVQPMRAQRRASFLPLRPNPRPQRQ